MNRNNITNDSVLAIYGYGRYGEVLEHILDDKYPKQLKYIIDDGKQGLISGLASIEIINLEQFCKLKNSNVVVILGVVDPSLVVRMSQNLEQVEIEFVELKELKEYLPLSCVFMPSEFESIKDKIEQAKSIFNREEDIDLYEFLFELRTANDTSRLRPLNPYRAREWDRQYCDFINPSHIGTFIDGGVFEGYTLHLMCKNLNFREDMNIYGFEPLRQAYEHSHFRDELENKRGLHIFYQALWDKKDVLHFFEQGTSSKIVENSDGIAIDATSIDKFVQEQKIAKVDFIKLDIEGAEIEAINGALKTIEKDRPQMAISIYHKKEHLYEIPILISNLCEDYTFRLGRYSPDAAETILYAIPNEIKVLDC